MWGIHIYVFRLLRAARKNAAPVESTVLHNVDDKGLLPRHRVSETGNLHLIT